LVSHCPILRFPRPGFFFLFFMGPNALFCLRFARPVEEVDKSCSFIILTPGICNLFSFFRARFALLKPSLVFSSLRFNSFRFGLFPFFSPPNSLVPILSGRFSPLPRFTLLLFFWSVSFFLQAHAPSFLLLMRAVLFFLGRIMRSHLCSFRFLLPLTFFLLAFFFHIVTPWMPPPPFRFFAWLA